MIYLSFTWDVTNTFAKISNDSQNTKYSHIPIQLYACMWACACALMHVCACAYVGGHLCVYVCVCMFVCMRRYMCVCIRVLSANGFMNLVPHAHHYSYIVVLTVML